MAFARQEKKASDTPRLFDINFHKYQTGKYTLKKKKKENENDITQPHNFHESDSEDPQDNVCTYIHTQLKL